MKPVTTSTQFSPRIMLAPMEGVVDYHMRKFLTSIGGYNRCVTEFVRVVDNIYPQHVFKRYCPELSNGGLTDAGIPVYVQLLGSNLDAMAGNARKAAKMGAPGIDINFGCPSKTVNKSDGGSVVLRTPSRVKDILIAVRDSVPAETPVTAKIRLGFDDADDFSEIISGIAQTGITELCVHARTKKQGYKPPAHWQCVSEAVRKLSIPVIINGEIWTPDDATKALASSRCSDLMLGRGAIACPDLALQIQSVLSEVKNTYQPLEWEVIWEQVRAQSIAIHHEMPRYSGMRTKQWLRYLGEYYPEAQQEFSRIKLCKTVGDMVPLW